MYRGLVVVSDYVDEAYTDLDHDVPHGFSQGTTDEKETRLLWKQAVEAYAQTSSMRSCQRSSGRRLCRWGHGLSFSLT